MRSDIARPEILPMGVLQAEEPVWPEQLALLYHWIDPEAFKELKNQVDKFEAYRRLECS